MKVPHVNTIESLEDRRMLSADAQVTRGVLQIRGDALRPNAIVVGNSADGTQVNVAITARSGNVNKSFPLSRIRSLNIIGGSKADTVTINQDNSPFTIKTRIHGREGNDTINSGDEVDTIGGGMGNDLVDSGAGNDLIFGGVGNDTVTGGAGNDTVWGGRGDDSVTGGEGDDKLGGFRGKNILHGEAGADTFVVRTLSNNVDNDHNAAEDILKSPTGSDDGDEPPAV